jgi:adenosylcobinamide kinase/adenosylcobinamide-phosphate guanylyltransferase
MKITFVIGGARSGKSSFALNSARSGKSSFALNTAAGIDGPKSYIATAEALDDEMAERIEKHKKDRGSEWDTYEETVDISGTLQNLNERYSVVVLDCLTLWLSNILIRSQNPEQRTQMAENGIKKLIDMLHELKNGRRTTDDVPRFFIVSNEVGMGIVPENDLAREFRDLAGFLNQKIAEISDEVYMVSAGIPVKIK